MTAAGCSSPRALQFGSMAARRSETETSSVSSLLLGLQRRQQARRRPLCSTALACGSALAALGIRLQEGPQACALLAAEECRQREKASLPPEPSPLSEAEVSSFVDEFFTKLDAPKEEVPT